jgi:S-adenosylmethionine:tRNA ribosyltransferase-isomerase
MKTSLFDYTLPINNIAQRPLEKRDASRMLVLDRKTGRVEHSYVRNLPQWLLPKDLVVVNQTKVFSARLYAIKPETGAKLEIFLLRPAFDKAVGEWEALITPAKRIKGNPVLKLEGKGEAAILESLGEGHFIIRLNRVGNVRKFLVRSGHVPLPPYIKRKDDSIDKERYQTIFAKKEGSVAAPTAGLHFTQPLMDKLLKKGIRKTTVTLHVGLGTFLPVSSEVLEEHVIHPERFEVPSSAAASIRQTRQKGGRIVAIGTTVVRALESAVQMDGSFRTKDDETRLFISPGYSFKVVDVIFTNFHQPCSTLLMLICAFAGRERVLAAYDEALRKGYRFLSYGDAMLIL